jgi:hypothetical protein
MELGSSSIVIPIWSSILVVVVIVSVVMVVEVVVVEASGSLFKRVNKIFMHTS